MATKREKELEAALSKVMPIIEEAFWDHHTAGTLPGSGYNHRVYNKVSQIFGWRDSKVFTDWKNKLNLSASVGGGE